MCRKLRSPRCTPSAALRRAYRAKRIKRFTMCLPGAFRIVTVPLSDLLECQLLEVVFPDNMAHIWQQAVNRIIKYVVFIKPLDIFIDSRAFVRCDILDKQRLAVLVLSERLFRALSFRAIRHIGRTIQQTANNARNC